MYVYLYMCIYVDIYVYVYLYMCIYVYVYLYMCIYVYVFHLASVTSVSHQEREKVSSFRVFNKRNFDRFEMMIDVIPWDDVYAHDDAEQAYQSFFMSFIAGFNKC